ncbi:PRD domain-containing protein [Enterococcus sp. AZ109]|uniref:PRD domain-containing protein n=1 Tax=Enterococcus sp. AZ109 TaxID=2774634 RepID=UPI003F217D35
MKVIQKINNNVAICLDNNNCELIAMGTGIGFPKTPYELTDLSKVERTFYGVNSRYLELINEIPEDVLKLTANIVDYASMLVEHELPSNLLFTLADHINFAILRHNKNMPVKLSIYYDVRHLHKLEVKVGEYALRLIKKKLGVVLYPDEALGIAMHLINSYTSQSNDSQKESQMLEDITTIIEDDFQLMINRSSMNYARFVSHMQYFIRREGSENKYNSENMKILDSVKQEYPQSFHSAQRVIAYIRDHYGWEPNSEELLYIMLHINRLCTREDCYR